MLGEVGPAEFHVVERAHGAEVLSIGAPDAVAVAFETIELAGRLPRVVLVVGHAEGAGQVHVGDVALHAETQAAAVIDIPLAAQAVVLHIGLRMLATVLATDGVDVQLQAEVVGQAPTGAQVAVVQLAPAGREGDTLLQGGFPLIRNWPADEVDHAADVVRSVLHGRAATHDVDAIDRRQGLRKQRQAGLAIGRQGQRDAIGERLDAAAATFRKPAHGQLRQYPGTGLVEDLHPWDPRQRVIQATHAGLLQFVSLDHAAAAGIGAYLFVTGTTKHIPLDDERGKGYRAVLLLLTVVLGLVGLRGLGNGDGQQTGSDADTAGRPDHAEVSS